MEANITLLLIPIISALIGWLTNIIAIKSLFRPTKKIKILGFTFQGLLPARQKQISKNLASIIDKHLFSNQDIIGILNKPETIHKIKEKITPHLTQTILEKIPLPFQTLAKPLITSAIDKEADSIIKKLSAELTNSIDETIDIKTIIEKKLISSDISNLEKIITTLAKKELKHIEILGAIIGFIVGLFQVIILLLI